MFVTFYNYSCCVKKEVLYKLTLCSNANIVFVAVYKTNSSKFQVVLLFVSTDKTCWFNTFFKSICAMKFVYVLRGVLVYFVFIVLKIHILFYNDNKKLGSHICSQVIRKCVQKFNVCSLSKNVWMFPALKNTVYT